MGGKGKKRVKEESINGYDEAKPSTSSIEKKTKQILPSMIKNKEKRSEIHAKLKHQKKLDKRNVLLLKNALLSLVAGHSAVRIRFRSKEGFAFFCMTLLALKIFQFRSTVQPLLYRQKKVSLKEGESLMLSMAGCLKWKPVVVILVIYLVMAILNILFKKILSEGKSQLVIVTYRLITSAIFLAPIAFFAERSNGIKLTSRILGQLFVSALIGATLTQYLYLLGMEYTSAALASAFTNMTPVFTFILALLLRQETVNLRKIGGQAKVLGSLFCIGGVLLLILYRGVPLNKISSSGKPSYDAINSHMGAMGENAQKWIIGSIFVVLSILLWAGWFLLQGRIGKQYPCKYSSTALMSFLGAIQSAILCFAVERDISVWILRGKLQILTLVSAGILGSGLCYVGMAWCVEQRGPVFTSAFTPFIQIYIIIIDLIFHNEQIYLGSIIGSILVICGLYVLLWGKTKSRGAENNSSKPTPTELVEGNGNAVTLGRTDTRPHTEAGTETGYDNFSIFQEEFGGRDIPNYPNRDVLGTGNDNC